VRKTEKYITILILTLSTWSVIMMATTRFQGSQSNRILLVELGSDAAALNQAVQAEGNTDREGVAHNVAVLMRHARLDFIFIVLYWATVLGLGYLAGCLGKPFFAAWSAVFISVAAVADILENTAILSAMRERVITDALAVDIAEYSQWKWAFFFLACGFLGLAMALNRHVSEMRRMAGRAFLAAGVVGIIGISRYRVSLTFTITMINVGVLLFSIGLLLTLWKLYQSMKELDELHPAAETRVHA